MRTRQEICIFIATILANQFLNCEGNGVNDSMQLVRASTACTGKEKDRVCKLQKFFYFPCSPGKCSTTNFQECADGVCQTCALQGQDCSEKMPCCDSQQYGIGGDGKRAKYRTSYCTVLGKCSYCINYGRQCSSVNGEREGCCETKGKGDVFCQPGYPSLCQEDPCGIKGKTLPNVPVRGFTQKVPRCNGYLSVNDADMKYDYECQGAPGMKSCVRCLGLDTDCSGGTTEECCPNYLECKNIDTKKKKFACKPKCGPRRFRCSVTKDCCPGLTCSNNSCKTQEDLKDPLETRK